MKKLITLILLCIAIVMPMTAKNVYVYNKNQIDPSVVSSEKLYFLSQGDNWSLYDSPAFNEIDMLLGSYNATAESAFEGYPTQIWSLSVTPDAEDETKVWIHPICEFGGLSADNINAVYGVVDTAANTITIPYGQCLYGGESSTYNMVLAGVAASPVLEGNMVATYEMDGSSVVIIINEWFGVGNVNANEWWYQALEAPITINKIDGGMSVGENIANIDSISVNPPMLELIGHEVAMDNGAPQINIYFNHSVSQKAGWFNKKITYTAYDENNKVVYEDAFDLYAGWGDYISACMFGLTLSSDGAVAYYAPDAFLPCDTALQVAVSIADNTVKYAPDTTIVYSGIKSSVEADGTRHGLVFDYYNERARLLSTSPLTGDNALSATLKYSKEMTSNLFDDLVYFSYSIYHKENGDVTEVDNGWAKGYIHSDSTVRVQITTTVPLVGGDRYIATLSCPCREEEYSGSYLVDLNWCSPVPNKIESCVDADGTPHGLWWEFIAEDIELSVTPPTQTNTKDGFYINTKDATKVVYRMTQSAIADIDWDTFIEEGYENTYSYRVELEDASRHFTTDYLPCGTYYLYVAATNEMGQIATYSTPYELVDNDAPSIISTFPLTATNRGRTVELYFDEKIVRESGMGAVSYKVYDTNVEVVAEGNIEDANLVASYYRLTVTLPATVEFAEGVQYVVVLSFAEGAVTDVYGNKMAAVDGYIADGIAHGPWWSVDIKVLASMTWAGVYYDGTEYPFETTTPVEMVGTKDLAEAGLGEAEVWSFSDFMVDYGLFSANDAVPFTGFFVNVEGLEALIIIDESLQAPALIANVVFQGETTASPIWLGYVEGTSINPDVSFVKENGVYVSMSENVCLFTEGEEEGYVSLVAYLQDLTLTETGGAAPQAAMASVAEQIAKFDRATAKKMKIGKEMRLIKR